MSHLAASCVLIAGCAAPPPLLSEYAADHTGPRLNEPAGYIDHLKATRFTRGELDHLPPYAILLHGDPETLLPAAGVDRAWWTTLELGTADPGRLYVVRPPSGTPFLVDRANPGAGGAGTQTAELISLGAKFVVHIGTSGLLGTAGDDRHVIVARAAHKDGGAVLLSDDDQPLATPDLPLTTALGERLGPAGVPMVGYTIPIYYFQPESLIKDLIAGDRFAGPARPGYMEMEEASVFAAARRMHAAAASLTVAADRYTVTDGKLQHVFLDDGNVTAALVAAVRATATTFAQIDRPAEPAGVKFWGDTSGTPRN
jgi:hypothetical protein